MYVCHQKPTPACALCSPFIVVTVVIVLPEQSRRRRLKFFSDLGPVFQEEEHLSVSNYDDICLTLEYINLFFYVNGILVIQEGFSVILTNLAFKF
jgi:hypothetical protein